MTRSLRREGGIVQAADKANNAAESVVHSVKHAAKGHKK